MTAARCAGVAETAGDPREGTAPPARQWFLVEHPGPWGRAALSQSGIDPVAVTAIDAWTRARGGRAALVRRPGRGRAHPERRWFRVDSRPGREEVRTGTFTTESELVTALDEPGEPHGPLTLVCAHGRHDVCCAVRGRPVAAALDEDRTWECTHIGGCRFAPAIVLLPHGLVFGGVPPAAAADLVAGYDAGVLDPTFLRGRSAHPPAVQAAQHHARARTGVLALDALRPVAVDAPAPGRWRVELADPACVVLLTERRVPTGRPLTCAATEPGVMRVFDLESVTG